MGPRSKKDDNDTDATQSFWVDVRDPTGKLNLKKVLSKTFSPATLVALIAAGTNQYVEYQALKTKVAEQQQAIVELRSESTSHDRAISENANRLTDAVRDRFSQNEDALAELQQALSNLQVELRVRFGVGRYEPDPMTESVRPRSRQEEIRAAAARVERAIERVETAIPEDEPLAGIE